MTGGGRQPDDEGDARDRAPLAEGPGEVEAAYRLALTWHLQGRRERALELLERLAHDGDAPSRVHVALALVRHALGRLEDARASCERALAREPGCLPALAELALLASERRDLPEAVRLHREVAARAPELAEAHHNLAVALQRLGHEEDAIEGYRRALAREPRYVAALTNLANALHRREGLDEAAELYRRILEVEPGHGLALHMSAALSGRSPPACPASFVVGLFDDCAERFDEQLVGRLGYATPALLRELVEAHAPDVALPFRRALDLGCGTGLAGAELRPRCAWLAGVDLSPRMIEVARARAVYDALHVGEAVAFLGESEDAYDLVVAADTIPYLGELDAWARALARACAPGAVAAFSVEALLEPELRARGRGDFALRPSGRYAHGRDYVLAVATDAGFRVEAVKRVALRREGDSTTAGDLFLLLAPPSGIGARPPRR